MLRTVTTYRSGEVPKVVEADFTGSWAQFIALHIRPIFGDVNVDFEQIADIDDGHPIRVFYPKDTDPWSGIHVVVDDD